MSVQSSGTLKAGTVINLLAGIWLIITPFALGGSSGAVWDGVIFGILILLCAIGRMVSPLSRGFSVANVIWGIWMLISPWVLGFAGTGIRWSYTVTGIIVAIVATICTREIAVVTSLPASGADDLRRAA